jgi:hypothetical protein
MQFRAKVNPGAVAGPPFHQNALVNPPARDRQCVAGPVALPA